VENMKYASIKIPQGFADEIIEVAIQQHGIYRIVSEFVIESSRRHLENIS
jgi:hypothetical protein